MSPSSPPPAHPSRNLAQLCLQRLAAVKNQTVAAAIGKDESTVSRIAAGETGIKLVDLQGFLGALGLKVVGAHQVCVDHAEFEAYRALATKFMTARGPALQWEEG